MTYEYQIAYIRLGVSIKAYENTAINLMDGNMKNANVKIVQNLKD